MNKETELAIRLNDTVQTNWEVITPEIAMEMLTHNDKNYRGISSAIVTKYANEIRGGSWETNGDTIVFDENGTLLNGQHRLTAVVKAGMPIVSLVVRGLTGTQVYDIGRKRNTRAILMAEGYDHANSTTISAVNVLVRGFDWRTTATISETREVLKAERDLLIEAYELVTGDVRSAVTRKASVMAATFCALKMKLCESAKIQQLFKIANSGFAIEGLNSSPGLALRMSLQEQADGKWASDARKGAFDMTIQAITDYERGINRKTKYRPSQKYEAIFNVVNQILVREILEGESKERITA